MATAKRYLLIALSFAVALTVFAAFAPRAVHAVTATLVQVVNGYANPVPTARADDPGRNPVTLQVVTSSSAITLSDFLQDGGGNPYTVPAGKRLVLDSASAFAFVPAGQKVYAHVAVGTSAFTYIATPPVLVGTFGGQDFFENHFVLKEYANPGDHVSYAIWRTGGGSFTYTITVSGHLVDCTNGGGC